jgi:hypothetical protein
MPSNCCDEIVADDGSGRVICEFPYGLDANSAHIVRAVNAHDELVEACRMALRVFDFKGPCSPNSITAKARKQCRDALAKAGEGA